MTYVSLFSRSDIVSGTQKELDHKEAITEQGNLFPDIYMNLQWRNPVYRLL